MLPKFPKLDLTADAEYMANYGSPAQQMRTLYLCPVISIFFLA